MTTAMQTTGPIVAGLITAECQCCQQPRSLIGHPDLDASRLMCPQTRRVHLDRGDGLFELEAARPTVTRLEPEPEQAADVTSDRPVRTGPKTRIELERATFA
jgi:hypothetical protein